MTTQTKDAEIENMILGGDKSDATYDRMDVNRVLDRLADDGKVLVFDDVHCRCDDDSNRGTFEDATYHLRSVLAHKRHEDDIRGNGTDVYPAKRSVLLASDDVCRRLSCADAHAVNMRVLRVEDDLVTVAG